MPQHQVILAHLAIVLTLDIASRAMLAPDNAVLAVKSTNSTGVNVQQHLASVSKSNTFESNLYITLVDRQAMGQTWSVLPYISELPLCHARLLIKRHQVQDFSINPAHT